MKRQPVFQRTGCLLCLPMIQPCGDLLSSFLYELSTHIAPNGAVSRMDMTATVRTALNLLINEEKSRWFLCQPRRSHQHCMRFRVFHPWESLIPIAHSISLHRANFNHSLRCQCFYTDAETHPPDRGFQRHECLFLQSVQAAA